MTNIILAYEDFKKGLVDLVNNSQLPMAIVQTVMENALVQVRELAVRQLEDAEKYEEYGQQ